MYSDGVQLVCTVVEKLAHKYYRRAPMKEPARSHDHVPGVGSAAIMDLVLRSSSVTGVPVLYDPAAGGPRHQQNFKKSTSCECGGLWRRRRRKHAA